MSEARGLAEFLAGSSRYRAESSDLLFGLVNIKRQHLILAQNDGPIAKAWLRRLGGTI